jgi:hypothetical protein
MVVCILTKETTLVLVPALAWQLWTTSDRRTRPFVFAVFGGLFAALLAAYPLIAVLKSELVPGDDHVSLLGSISWQLFGRASSGSVLDAASNARGLLALWLGIDSWLLVLGVLAVPVALFVPRLRPVAAGLGIQALMPLRPGYLPYPYVIAMLPFAALVVAGTLDAAWRARPDERGGGSPARPHDGVRSLGQLPAARAAMSQALAEPSRRPLIARRTAVALAAVVFVAVGLPAWFRGLHEQVTADNTLALREASAWLGANTAPDDVLVVDDSLWVDMVERGRSPEQVIWFYKVDLDPAVKLADGWRSIDYVVLGSTGATTDGLPTVQAALDRSEVVASFGSGPDALTIRRVASE